MFIAQVLQNSPPNTASPTGNYVKVVDSSMHLQDLRSFMSQFFYRLTCFLPTRRFFNYSQYFNKYCAPSEDSVATTSERRGLANMLSGWWQGGSAEGLVIGAGVDERLIRGLSEEVEGFSGREVMKRV